VQSLELKSRVRGKVLLPKEEGYDAERAGWNLIVEHHPKAIVVAASAEDVAAAVQYAASEGLPVGVQATGVEDPTGRVEIQKGAAQEMGSAVADHIRNPQLAAYPRGRQHPFPFAHANRLSLSPSCRLTLHPGSMMCPPWR
jgi:hypothetical protein